MARATRSLPDFLGIGAHRAGTSWLYANLKEHPDIWLPPRKELHYFDRSTEYPSPDHLACASMLFRLVGLRKHNLRYKRELFRALLSIIADPSRDHIRWNAKYFFGSCDDRWYASLFEESANRTKGEITPAYSMLHPKDVEHVRRLIPGARIIFLIRNPVERTWSAIRFREKLKRSNLTSLPLEKLVKAMDRPGIALRSDYAGTIRTWRACFPEEQFFIGFYEDVARQPRELLIRLFEFLGVESREAHVTDRAVQRVNVSPEKELPEGFRIHLAATYHAQLKELSDMLGGYATSWLEEAEAMLRAAGRSF